MVSWVHYIIFKIIYCAVWPHPIEHQAAYKKGKETVYLARSIFSGVRISGEIRAGTALAQPPRVELSAAVNTQHELS